MIIVVLHGVDIYCKRILSMEVKQDGAATCAQVHRLSVILGIYSICSGILLLELCMDTHQ